MANGNGVPKRKKDSAKLVWDTKPKRAASPKDIEFQTAEIVIPNPKRDQTKLPLYSNGSKAQMALPKKLNVIWLNLCSDLRIRTRGIPTAHIQSSKD